MRLLIGFNVATTTTLSSTIDEVVITKNNELELELDMLYKSLNINYRDDNFKPIRKFNKIIYNKKPRYYKNKAIR